MIQVLIEGEDEGENPVYYPHFGPLNTVKEARRTIAMWMKSNRKFFPRDRPPRFVIVEVLEGEFKE